MPLFDALVPGRKARRMAQAQSETAAIIAAVSDVRPAGGYADLGSYGRATTQSWQVEALDAAHLLGEISFFANYVSAGLSRCRITLVDVDDAGQAQGETENQVARDVLKLYFGAEQGQMLASFGPHLALAGDSYLVGFLDEKKTTVTDWRVVSIRALREFGGKYQIDGGGGNWRTYEKNALFLKRIFRPDFEYVDLAWSAMRAALPIVRELLILAEYRHTLLDSRLVGNGILWVPIEADFPETEEDQPGYLQGLLHAAMAAAIKDRKSASAREPLIVEIPGDLIEKVKHMDFSSELTAIVLEMEERAQARLGVSLDVPPEVFKGVSVGNHFSAWQIEESAIKLTFEVYLGLIAAALYEGVLAQALATAGLDPTKFQGGFDSAALRLRPSRGQDAKELGAAGIISAEAVRDANGFLDSDAPEAKTAEQIALELIQADPKLIVDPGVPALIAALQPLVEAANNQTGVGKPAPRPTGGATNGPPGN